MNYPIKHTNEERLKLANDLLDQLKNKYGDNLLAVAIYGSVARGDDASYSDVELLVVIKGQGVDVSFEQIVNGLKFNIDVITKEVGFEEISKVNLNWSRVVGIYLDVQPLFDPENIFQEYKDHYHKVIQQDFKKDVKKSLFVISTNNVINISPQ